MEIFTIGFAGKSAETFFGLLRRHKIRRLIDIRLSNSSQLAGFTKQDSLPFFLKELCNAEYVHELRFAPTEEMFTSFKKEKGDWRVFERQFLSLMKKRQIEKVIDKSLFEIPAVLLCSEATPEHCHRRLVAEYLKDHWKGVTVTHL